MYRRACTPIRHAHTYTHARTQCRFHISEHGQTQAHFAMAAKFSRVALIIDVRLNIYTGDAQMWVCGTAQVPRLFRDQHLCALSSSRCVETNTVAWNADWDQRRAHLWGSTPESCVQLQAPPDQPPPSLLSLSCRPHYIWPCCLFDGVRGICTLHLFFGGTCRPSHSAAFVSSTTAMLYLHTSKGLPLVGIILQTLSRVSSLLKCRVSILVELEVGGLQIQN